MTTRRRRWLPLVTLVGGLAFIAGGISLTHVDRRSTASVATLAPLAIASSAYPTVVASAAPTALPTNAPPPRARAPELPLGDGWRLRLTRLGIDLPLREGDIQRDLVSQATPEGSAFLFPSTARPGAPGNSYIYAHARVGMFLALWRVVVGDLVEVTGQDGVIYRYEVTEIHPRVDPAGLTYAQPMADDRITLQTSTGPNPSDPRFVVVARRQGQ